MDCRTDSGSPQRTSVTPTRSPRRCGVPPGRSDVWKALLGSRRCAVCNTKAQKVDGGESYAATAVCSCRRRPLPLVVNGFQPGLPPPRQRLARRHAGRPVLRGIPRCCPNSRSESPLRSHGTNTRRICRARGEVADPSLPIGRYLRPHSAQSRACWGECLWSHAYPSTIMATLFGNTAPDVVRGRRFARSRAAHRVARTPVRSRAIDRA